MNYEIIKDENLFREFIEWLPELKKTEQYYVCLFARNKYCKELTHIKSDKAQLKRFTSTKERLFDKIWQLESEVGSYKQKENPIPQEALAIYITPNPRDLWKATFNSVIKLTECIRDQNMLMNPHQDVMSEIQKSVGTRHFVDFDIDEADPVILNQAMGNVFHHVNESAVNMLRTRGGVHVLVEPRKVEAEYRDRWYKGISTLAVDQVGDQLIPIPGCTQGNFIPHFIKI